MSLENTTCRTPGTTSGTFRGGVKVEPQTTSRNWLKTFVPCSGDVSNRFSDHKNPQNHLHNLVKPGLAPSRGGKTDLGHEDQVKENGPQSETLTLRVPLDL